MAQDKRSPVSDNEITGIISNKEKLMAEIRRIKNLRGPVTDKIGQIRELVDQFFHIAGNEERLNANLPLVQ